MAREYGILQPNLYRLQCRFLYENFFKNLGWEVEVIDSGLLSNNTDSSDGVMRLHLGRMSISILFWSFSVFSWI